MKCPDRPAAPLTARERFTIRFGIRVADTEHIVELANLIARCGEKEHNGDPHRKSKRPGNKNENANNWGAQRDRHISALKEFVKCINLTVWLNGLRPSLRDASGTFIEIPH